MSIEVQQHLLRTSVLPSPVNDFFFILQRKNTFQLHLDVVSSCNLGHELRAMLNISQVQGFHVQNTGFKSISNFNPRCRCATIDKTLQQHRQIITSTRTSEPTARGSQNTQPSQALPRGSSVGEGRRPEITSQMVLCSSRVTLTPRGLITHLRKLKKQKVGERRAHFREMTNKTKKLSQKIEGDSSLKQKGSFGLNSFENQNLMAVIPDLHFLFLNAN